MLYLRTLIAFLLTFSLGESTLSAAIADAPSQKSWNESEIEGWRLYVSKRFENKSAPEIEKAKELLQTQLKEIKSVVPSSAVSKLQQVSLYFSPEYPGIGPRAEYHPSRGWLRENGRDPVMEKGIEFTNISIFAEETRRMPNFALHELAHAFHDQVHGFDNQEIETAYRRAKAGAKYDRVQRQDSEGNLTWDRAYAITNSSEYFAETSEAFFSRNDFYPFHREELKSHDPLMDQLLEKLWNIKAP